MLRQAKSSPRFLLSTTLAERNYSFPPSNVLQIVSVGPLVTNGHYLYDSVAHLPPEDEISKQITSRLVNILDISTHNHNKIIGRP